MSMASLDRAAEEAAISLGLRSSAQPHRGMPDFDSSGPPVSFFEFWPGKLFYAPVVAWCVWLALRHGHPLALTASNPKFPAGGLVGESKLAILSLAKDAAKAIIAPFAGVTVGADRAASVAEARVAMAGAGLGFPLVMKPDMGCRGVGVQLARGPEDLARYIPDLPEGHALVLQEYVQHEAEAGVFYIRYPGEARGRVISITLKYVPHVTGDGAATLRALIERDPRAGRLRHLYLPRHAARLDHVVPAGEHVRLAFAGSHSRGTIFRDGTRLVTEAMERAFDRVADGIEGFHFGRFDVRAESIAALQEGRDFRILEINGAGGESTHIWDRNMTLPQAYRALFRQFAHAYAIGAANMARGARPTSIREILRLWRKEKALWAAYPPTQ